MVGVLAIIIIVAFIIGSEESHKRPTLGEAEPPQVVSLEDDDRKP